MALTIPHRYTSLAKEELDSSEVVPSRGSANVNSGTRCWRIQLSLPLLLVLLLLQFSLGAFVATLFAHLDGNQSRRLVVPLTPQLYDEEGNYYPAAVALKHEIRTFAPNFSFITFAGPPTDRVDLAWENLQGPTDGVIQASSRTGFEMDKLPPTLRSEKEDEWGMYGLEVYHQLHCLDIIRKSFWPDNYFPGADHGDIDFHRAHCVEHLRQSIMCNGDFTLDYWKRNETTGVPWLKVDVPHVCRNFDSMRGWVVESQRRDEDW